MSQGPLKLDDHEFWGDTTRTKPDVLAKVSGENFHGLIIDAPDIVPLRDRTTAPVAGYWIRTLRDDLAIDQWTQILAAATNFDTNDVTVGIALAPQKHPVPQNRPSGDPGEGTVLNGIVSDLRDALVLPWEPAKYRVAFLCREFLSNAVTTEFGRPPSDFKDAEVTKFLEEQRKKVPPPPPAQVFPPKAIEPDGLPNYGKLPDSPPIPEAVGIEFTVPRIVVSGPAATCILKGSYKLAVLPRERVAPRGEATDKPDVGDPKATAVLQITLVVTGSDAPGPWRYPLFVPTYDPVKPGSEPAEATGHFAIDLFQLPEFPQTPMTYFIVALNGEVVSGPKAVGVVTPEMLVK